MLQSYEARVNDEFVLRGNAAVIKCIVPSFVADFVHIGAWILDNVTLTAEEYSDVDTGILCSTTSNAPPCIQSHAFAVVHQAYEPRVIDEYVLRGNPAIVKCLIPSFVADYVVVYEWLTDDGETLESGHGNSRLPRDLDSPHPSSVAYSL